MHNRLGALLNSSRLREELDRFVEVLRDIPPSSVVSGGSEFYETAVRQEHYDLLVEKASKLFHSHVMRGLPRPHVVTCEDLVESLWEAVQLSELSNWYELFLTVVTARSCLPRTSQPVEVIAGRLLVFDGQDNTYKVWNGSGGMSIHVAGDVALEDVTENHESQMGVAPKRMLYLRVHGTCSQRAILQFQKDASNVIATVLRSIECLRHLGPEAPLHDTYYDREWIPYRPVALNHYTSDDRLETWTVRPLLDAFFSDPGKKDSMDRRIRNAVHLLIQADQQLHTSIGLSLTVAAIESLICNSSEGIALQMAENTATLLEPDMQLRSSAEKFVKSLYGQRSKTLHGEYLDHEADDRLKSRQLAAAVLHAVLDRREYQRRMGDPCETPDDLLAELRQSKYIGGETPGVRLSPARKLWRPPPQIPVVDH